MSLKYLRTHHLNTKNKIVNLKVLKAKLVQLRRQGQVIAFTNGCFDILHAGHINYLQKARKENRILIVGLNSDRSVKKIKGEKRPIMSDHERASLLAGLSCVDFVIIFDEETPTQLIKAIRPDILIKGADWKDKEVAGAHFVKQYRGKVEYIQYLPKFSSTNVIQTILERYRN